MKKINAVERKKTVSPHSIGLFPLSYAMNLVQNAAFNNLEIRQTSDENINSGASLGAQC